MRLKLIGSLSHRTLDRLGDWNPQLLRELKGRLKWFPVLTAIGLSLLVQVMILVGFVMALPGTVETNDIVITTDPLLGWSSAAQLPRATQAQVLPTDPVENRIMRAKGLFIEYIEGQDATWGNTTLGEAALEQLQVGDRLIALNGVPVAELERAVKTEVSGDPEAIWLYEHMQVHQQNVTHQENETHQYELSQATPPLTIDSIVTLTLSRPGPGEFTVDLPYVGFLRRSPDYCLSISGQCQLTADQQTYVINWRHWHANICATLSGLMTVSLMGLGTFLLTNNLIDEQQRGTLNFLRMSPRSSLMILGGKLLGVPIYLYLAIAAMWPWQMYAAFSSGIDGVYLFGCYVAVLSQTLILYAVALLLGVATRAPLLMSLMPWLAAAGSLGFQWLVLWLSLDASIYWEPTDVSTVSNWAVLFSPMGSLGYYSVDNPAIFTTPIYHFGIFQLNFVEYTVLTVLHACGWCALFGHSLYRRFEHPTQTLLTRRYSYLLTGIFMAIVLGLSETYVERSDLFALIARVIALGVLYSFLLILSLTCDRQTLQDWARFRTARTSHEGRLPLGRDLLIGDTSSPVIAIGLNLVLMVSMLTVWFVFYHRQLLTTKIEVWGFVGSLLLFVGSIFFAVLANQVLLLTKRPKSWFWYSSIGSLSCLLFPGVTLVIGVGLLPKVSSVSMWGLPPEVAMFVMPAGLMGGLTLVLAMFHWRQLVLVGRSEYQQLVAADRDRSIRPQRLR